MKIYRIARWFVLAALVLVILLALKRPTRPEQPQTAPQNVKQQSAEFQAKINQLEQASSNGDHGAEVQITSDEVNAALKESLRTGTPTNADLGQVPISAPEVSFEGDQVRGVFPTRIYGKDVYVTVAGRLGSQNGYATFEPTEFKVGDFIVPVALVNGALQKKLADPENREKLKLPDFIGDVRVVDGQLVVTQK
ncbi:MAG TPA: hypothetical protein VKW78_21740 [Terriglobales bacterium]|nr:hypothetical protein [Terriglobales bacterium]